MSSNSEICTSISRTSKISVNMGSFSHLDEKTATATEWNRHRDGDTRFRYLKSIASAYRVKVQVSCEAREREYCPYFKLISKESMIATNRTNDSRPSTCSTTTPRGSNLNFKMSHVESQPRVSFAELRSRQSQTKSLQNRQSSTSTVVGRLKSQTNNSWYQQLGSYIGLNNNKLPRRTSTSQNCSIYASGSRHNQTEKIPYHPSFIEPVHCVGIGNSNRRNSNTCMDDDDYEIPFCDCSKNFHDYDADPNCPDENPCGSLKSRLCSPPGSQAFDPIPFEKPKTVFGDFTVPDEWKLKEREDDCDCDDTSKSSSSQTDISQAECPEGEELFCPDDAPSSHSNSKNPNAINYDAIGDVDDYFVDRNVIKLCPQLMNFCPTPFASPKDAFSDFKCAAGSGSGSGPGSGSGSGSGSGTENKNKDCICEDESYNSGCKECLQNLQRELRAGTLSGRSTSGRCRFQYNPNKTCCKESFDEFVARKRWEAKLEELTRVQNEKRAAADAAAAANGSGGAGNCDACAKQNSPEDEDCDCYCPDDMECYMEDTTEDCLMDLEMVTGDDCGCDCPCDDQLEPEELPICTESDDLAANNCSTGDVDGEGDACAGGAGAGEETESGACAECKESDCAECCAEPTPCQQKIFDMKAQLLVADANHEKELLKKDLDHYKEKIQGYQSTILKVQSKLKLHQQKQREHLKKKCACIKKKAAEKQDIQNELDCYRGKLEEMQRRLETYQRKEGQLRATAAANNNARGSSHSFASRAPSPCPGPKRVPSSLSMQNSKQHLPRGMGAPLGLGQPLGTTACHGQGQGQGQGPRTNIPLLRMRSQQSFPLPGHSRSPERQRSSANVLSSCGGGGAKIQSQPQGQGYYQGQGQGHTQRSRIPVAIASASMSMSNSNFNRQNPQMSATGSQCETAGQSYGKGRPEANKNACGFKVAKKQSGCCWGGWEEIPPWQPPAKKVAATSSRTYNANIASPGCVGASAGSKLAPPIAPACPSQCNSQLQPPPVPQRSRSRQGQQERKC